MESGVWWEHNTNISGPGVYSLKFKIKAGTGNKRFKLYGVYGKGGDVVGGSGTDVEDSLVSATYYTPTNDWVEQTLTLRITNPGHRRLRIILMQESGATAGTYHLVSDLGVYKTANL